MNLLGKINKLTIKLKENLEPKDAVDIKKLEMHCREMDQTSLKLEIDYKLSKAEEICGNLSKINEFMYYDDDTLIGYIGISQFSRGVIEVNGMVHPEYRRRSVFKSLFSLAKDEWSKREFKKVLLLCDNKSFSGQEFVKYTCANYYNSEYEMFLKNAAWEKLTMNNVLFRNATNEDAKALAWQDSIYFDEEFNEADISMPEEEETYGIYSYIAEVNKRTIGKVRLEFENGIGGIYGLGVLPEFRRRGYGKEIITFAIKKFKENNLHNIKLQVSTVNRSALNIYRACGFEETSVMDYYEYK